MNKSKENMDGNIVLKILGWTFAAVATVGVAYVGYKYSGRLKKAFNGDEDGKEPFESDTTRQTTTDNIDCLRKKCWETYVQLQTVIARKEACRKCIVGDTGIETALSQLKNILTSGRDNAYMAPRITDQVCGFIANTLVARRMVGADGTINMPEPQPTLMEREIYFRNIAVAPAEQAEKYRKVADYQRSRIDVESSDTRFAITLNKLLPWIQQAYDIGEGKTTLPPEQAVAWGKEFFDKSSQIIETYGK